VRLIALWGVLGVTLSVIASQVRDWNAMTDELAYERLALSIVQLHTLVPHTHGAFVRSLAQLYPALISPFFVSGYVPTDIVRIHVFDAWLMSSACIPAYLLARRVTGRRSVAYVLALLTVCTPWIVYSTVLLTENAGYPAFLWAILAMHKTITEPSKRSDVLALLGLALAFFARTQFLLLTGVLPIALVLYLLTAPGAGGVRVRLSRTARVAVRDHALLVVVYVAGLAAAAGYAASGGRLLFLSVYGGQASSRVLPPGTAGSITGHLADLSFGVGILPLLVGVGWLLANSFRSTLGPELRAFACVGFVTCAVLVSAISAWDLKIGHFALDRYLFYLVPLLLLACLCALLDERRPRWSLVLPTALVAFGFGFHLQEDFLWSGSFPLSTDSPIATGYRWVADVAGGEGGASVLLAVVTIVLPVLFVVADRSLRRDRLLRAFTAVLIAGLAANTTVTFVELFSRPGHSARHLTSSESPEAWLDRLVGTGAQVTEIPYPISTSFDVSQQFWRDLEFWNKSIRYGVHYPTDDTFRDAYIWFPPNRIHIDPKTGVAGPSRTPYVVQSEGETRFRISGTIQLERPDVMLIDARMPWRVDWLTFGLYDDGWTRPNTPARIRVFAAPGQHGPVTRTLTVQVRLPPNLDAGSFTLRSGLATVRKKVVAGETALVQLPICVPASGNAEARLTTPVRATIPGDQQSQPASTEPRVGGVLVAEIALADEVGGPCRPAG
jgi:hypothetical protein